MQKILFILKLSAIVLATASCSPKAITGPLTDCEGQKVSCKGYRFKVSGIAPKCGETATFTRTVNRKLINCKKIK